MPIWEADRADNSSLVGRRHEPAGRPCAVSALQVALATLQLLLPGEATAPLLLVQVSPPLTTSAAKADGNNSELSNKPAVIDLTPKSWTLHLG